MSSLDYALWLGKVYKNPFLLLSSDPAFHEKGFLFSHITLKSWMVSCPISLVFAFGNIKMRGEELSIIRLCHRMATPAIVGTGILSSVIYYNKLRPLKEVEIHDRVERLSKNIVDQEWDNRTKIFSFCMAFTVFSGTIIFQAVNSKYTPSRQLRETLGGASMGTCFALASTLIHPPKKIAENRQKYEEEEILLKEYYLELAKEKATNRKKEREEMQNKQETKLI